MADVGIQAFARPVSRFSRPMGNRIEIVNSDNIQFTKAPNVLRGMGLTHLSNNQRATKELPKRHGAN